MNIKLTNLKNTIKKTNIKNKKSDLLFTSSTFTRNIINDKKTKKHRKLQGVSIDYNCSCMRTYDLTLHHSCHNNSKNSRF